MTDIVERLRGYDPHPSTLELEAADEIERLRALSQPEGKAEAAAVKPLEWLRTRPDSQLSFAETIIGIYRVWTHHEANGEWYWNGDGDCHTVLSEEIGKAAAQADFEARIRAALQPSGQTRAEIIEECAKVATSFLVGDPANGVPLRNPMAHEIAAAVRALAAQEKE